MLRSTIGFATALLLATACGPPQMPVPVRGSMEPLVGRWTGEYTSRESGRAGSIVFTLEAGRDTASGDVLMIPANPEYPSARVSEQLDPATRPPTVLRISFVRCEGNLVTGWLDPYRDPDTGEKVSTMFEGTIRGDRLEGTYTSILDLSGRRQTGKWVVTRKKGD